MFFFFFFLPGLTTEASESLAQGFCSRHHARGSRLDALAAGHVLFALERDFVENLGDDADTVVRIQAMREAPSFTCELVVRILPEILRWCNTTVSFTLRSPRGSDPDRPQVRCQDFFSLTMGLLDEFRAVFPTCARIRDDAVRSNARWETRRQGFAACWSQPIVHLVSRKDTIKVEMEDYIVLGEF